MKKLILLLFLMLSQLEVWAYHPEKFQGEAQIRYVIEHYFQQNYQAQKDLRSSDFSYQIADWIAETRAWAAEETALRQIILEQAKIYNLGLIDYEFQLEIKSIRYRNNGEKALVDLRESHQVVFAATKPFVSELAKRHHLISLRLRDNIWYISYDQYDHEYGQMLQDLGKEKILEKMSANYKSDNQIVDQTTKQNAAIVKENFYPYD